MRRRPTAVLAASLLLCVILAAGCGGSDSEADAPAPRPQAAATTTSAAHETSASVPEGWVSIEDCEGVDAILRSLPNEAEARAFLQEQDFGRETKIKREDDGTFAWLGGGVEGTGTCDFGS